MVYEKDYILRMIEMIGDLIAGILGHIRKGEFSRASVEIGEVYNNILREDSSFFTKIPKEKLTHELLRVHNYSNGHLEILSELFFAEAELEFARGKYKECTELYDKSLILLEFIDNEQKIYSAERIRRMELIKNRLKEAAL